MASPADLGRAVAAALLLLAPATAHAAPAGDPFAPRSDRSWTARIVTPTAAWNTTPGRRGRKWLATVPAQSPWSGGPMQLMVLASRVDDHGREWLRVQLPSRPNGRSAWIRRDDALTQSTRFSVRISIGRRTVAVMRRGRLLHRFRAVVGATGTPTPRGRFAILESVALRPADGFLGPWALHLTAHSSVLEDFGGGKGRVAIHGRDGASLADPLGSARSHGCVRITNHWVRWMARHLIPGTPVRIGR